MANPKSKREFQLDRSSLVGCVEETLQSGGGTSAEVLLVRVAGGFVVVKDFAGRPRWVRETLGRWLTFREQRAYRQLEGVDLVPDLLGSLDRYAFVLEYRPGRLLSRTLKEELPGDFLSQLQRGVAEMHARGVVHLDLSHRSNILLGEDGRPVLLDFASAIRLTPRGVLRRALLALLSTFDRRAVRKWQAKFAWPSPTRAPVTGSRRGPRVSEPPPRVRVG